MTSELSRCFYRSSHCSTFEIIWVFECFFCIIHSLLFQSKHSLAFLWNTSWKKINPSWKTRSFKWESYDLTEIFSLIFVSLERYSNILALFRNCGFVNTFVCRYIVNTVTESRFMTYETYTRSSRPKMFLAKGVLKIRSASTGEYPWQSVISIYWNYTLVWIFSCKYAAYFQNTFF